MGRQVLLEYEWGFINKTRYLLCIANVLYRTEKINLVKYSQTLAKYLFLKFVRLSTYRDKLSLYVS
jgi:hypothetical protein